MIVASRLGIRGRLAIALIAVALLAVGLSTLFSNLGLRPNVDQAAHERLQSSAVHAAGVASVVYGDSGAWTPNALRTLGHLAAIDGLRLAVLSPSGQPLGASMSPPRFGAYSARAPVVVSGRRVADIVVERTDGQLLTPEEMRLQHSLDRLHLVAGLASVGLALLSAVVLAQTLSRPLRRIRYAAERVSGGDLEARAPAGGGPELTALAETLNRLAETLEREEELRKESVADLTHELRTPVTGILSRIEAAQDGVLKDEAANLAAMHEEASRLSALLDDLSHLAEAQRPGLLLRKGLVDLAQVGERQARSFSPRFKEKGIDFATDLRPVDVEGDAGRLEQVVANLLSNALRYTEPGGSVSLRVDATSDTTLLEVRDTGIGISEEDLPHVFTRFWRGEKSRSRETGGAGIGLSIVQELVRAHAGRVEVASSPGKGATFRILLPRAPRP